MLGQEHCCRKSAQTSVSLLLSRTFKISDAFMAEINKDQESIPNTHNDFYYKRKNENAAIADTVNRSHLSVYCTFLYF